MIKEAKYPAPKAEQDRVEKLVVKRQASIIPTAFSVLQSTGIYFFWDPCKRDPFLYGLFSPGPFGL